MAKVSVIIPVYNVEKYLPQCMDSVVGQTLEDIEIICVDDGSTDGSPQILDEYAVRDDRVRVIHQDNCHVSTTRNNGMALATGEYIICWDSDDYFALDALEKMYNRVKEYDADICVCNAQDFDSESGDYLSHNYLNKPLPEEDVFNAHTYKERIFTFTAPVPWNKLIRRRLIEDEQIIFPTEFKVVEDVIPMFTALACAEKIVIYNEKLIFYRINRNDSLTSNFEENIFSVFTAYEGLKKVLEKKGLLEDKDILRSFYNKALIIYLYEMKYCNTYQQFADYYRSLAEIRVKNLGLDNIPEGYMYNPVNEEKYRNLFDISPEEYLFWQFKELNRNCAEQRQKVSDWKKKHSELKKTSNSKIKKLRAKVKENEELIASSETQKSEYKKKIKSLNKQVQKSQEDIEALLKENASLKNELKNKISQLVETTEAFEKKKEEVENIRNSRAFKICKKLFW